MDYITIDEAAAVVIALGAASASATIPPTAERIGIVCSGNAHWRMGKGTQTAIATDPLVSASQGVMVVKVKDLGTGKADTIACIQDGTSTGNLSVFTVREG